MSFNAIIWAMKAQTKSPTAKLVLICLADKANDNGECWPSLQTISQVCEITRRSAITQTDKLEELGLIKIKRRSKKGLSKSNVYKLCFSSENISPPLVNDDHHPSENESPPVVNEFHPNLSVESVNESLPSNTPSENGAGKPSFSEISFFCKDKAQLVDPQEFFNHYESLDWMISGSPVRDWKSLVLSWNKNRKEDHGSWDEVDLPFDDS